MAGEESSEMIVTEKSRVAEDMASIDTKVYRWWAENGGRIHETTARECGLKTLEEAVELALAAGASAPEVFRKVNERLDEAAARKEIDAIHHTVSRVDNAQIADEIADVFICVSLLSSIRRIAREQAVLWKLEVLHSRHWTPNEHGILKRGRR